MLVGVVISYLKLNLYMKFKNDFQIELLLSGKFTSFSSILLNIKYLLGILC